MELWEIAKRADIFSVFWKNMQKEGIDDVVIPIRSRSDMVSDIFQKEFFDFIYIDGDHRYKSALNDIKLYAPLLKQGGIISGDDCEGYVSDYDRDFLEMGKSFDAYEFVHCGVVLAVAEYFPVYSLNYNIWSARKVPTGWECPNISFDLVKDRRQYQPPVIGEYKGYNLMRYKKLTYAVPQHINQFDVTDEVEQQNPLIITGRSVHEAKKLIDEHVMPYPHPHLIEENYKGFNIIGYRDKYYAIDVAIGDMDISKTDLSKHIKDGRCFVGDSIAETKHFTDLYRKELARKSKPYPHPHLIEENYKGFNIIGYRDKYYAIDVAIGDMDISKTDLSKHIKDGRCFVGDSIAETKHFMDNLYE
jgi:hypothetical protein